MSITRVLPQTAASITCVIADGGNTSTATAIFGGTSIHHRQLRVKELDTNLDCQKQIGINL